MPNGYIDVWHISRYPHALRILLLVLGPSADAPFNGSIGHAGSDGLDDNVSPHIGVAPNANTSAPARFLSQYESHDEPPPSGHVKWPHGG